MDLATDPAPPSRALQPQRVTLSNDKMIKVYTSPDLSSETQIDWGALHCDIEKVVRREDKTRRLC